MYVVYTSFRATYKNNISGIQIGYSSGDRDRMHAETFANFENNSF